MIKLSDFDVCCMTCLHQDSLIRSVFLQRAGRALNHGEWSRNHQRWQQHLSVRRRRRPPYGGKASLLFLFCCRETKVKHFSLCKGSGAPAASVSSLTRLPQQDIFHAIVEVACWKHNGVSRNPKCTSPGTRAALWGPVGEAAGSGRTKNSQWREQRQKAVQ